MSVIRIKQGDNDTITETISGLSSLTGYAAKMYIYTSEGTAIDTITGTISGLTAVYQLLNESTKAYTVGRHRYETKLYKESGGVDYVYTPSRDAFVVEATIEEDVI